MTQFEAGVNDDLKGKSSKARFLRKLLDDPGFRKVFRNTTTLLTGNVGASGLSFISTAITARALGPEEFGILVSVRAYSNVMKDLADSKCVLPLIKYAAEAISAGADRDFLKLVKLGIVIDICTALLGGSIAILGAPFASRWLHWDPPVMNLALMYTAVLFCNLINTPTMILRVTDRYRTCAMISTGTSLMTLCAVITGSLMHVGLRAYVTIWMATEISMNVFLLIFAGREVGWRRMLEAAEIPLRETWQKFRGFWSFLASVNLTSTVRMATGEMDTLLVTAALGTTSAGFYKVIKQIALIPAKLVDPLSQVVYPSLAQTWAERDNSRFKSLLALAAVFGASCATAVFMVMFFLGKTVVQKTFGAAYLPALAPMHWYLAGAIIGATAFSLDRSLLIMGRASLSLLLVTLSTGVYFLAFFPLVHHVHLVGVSLDYMLFQLVWAACIAAIVSRELLRARI